MAVKTDNSNTNTSNNGNGGFSRQNPAGGQQAKPNGQLTAIQRPNRNTGQQVLDQLESFAINAVKKAGSSGSPLGIAVIPLPAASTGLLFSGLGFVRNGFAFIVLYEDNRYVPQPTPTQGGVSVPAYGSLNVFDEQFYKGIHAALSDGQGNYPKVVGHYLVTKDTTINDSWFDITFYEVYDALIVADAYAAGMTSFNIPSEGKQVLQESMATTPDGMDGCGMPAASSYTVTVMQNNSGERRRQGGEFSVNNGGGANLLLTASGDVTLAPVEVHREGFKWYPVITVSEVRAGRNSPNGIEVFLLGVLAAFNALMAGGERWIGAFNRGSNWDKLAHFGATNVLSGMKKEGPMGGSYAAAIELNNTGNMLELASYVLSEQSMVELAVDLNVGGESSPAALIIRDALFATGAVDERSSAKELADAITRLTGGQLVYSAAEFFSGYELYPVGTVSTNKGVKDLRVVCDTLSVLDYATQVGEPQLITEWLLSCNKDLAEETAMELKMKVLAKLYGPDNISVIGYGYRAFLNPAFIEDFIDAAVNCGWNPELTGGYAGQMLRKGISLKAKRTTFTGSVSARTPGGGRVGGGINRGRYFDR